MTGLPARQVIDKQLHQEMRISRRRAMPGKQQTRRIPEGMTSRQRLLTADVNYRASQLPLLQRTDQRLIDHRHTASGIDKQRTMLAGGEQRGVINIAGGRSI